MPPNLIIALDFDSKKKAFSLIDSIDSKHCALKVGSEMFTHFGPNFVRDLVKREFKVFLDLKFHDIPNTVAKACKAAADLGVWMLNVHAMGGLAMMRAAKKALETYKQSQPLLIAVTILTSIRVNELPTIGISDELLSQVLRLSKLANEAELDGVVCSPYEASKVKEHTSKPFITVTPGIRLADNEHQDQSRVMTPHAAIRTGSDYIVMGRSITQAQFPKQVVDKVLKELSSLQ